MSSVSAYTLLLDLDGLFDTRMGTLLTLDQGIASYLSVKDYQSRQMDDFETLTGGRITNQAFMDRYANRDADILRKSMITGIVPVLITYLDGLKERMFRKVDVSSIRVDINLYPYSIPAPTIETIKNCLAALLPPYVEVGAGNYALDKLTPEFMDRYYNGWVCYDIHAWLELHQEALLVKPINGVSAILPKLFKKEPGEHENADDEVFRGADKHGLFELVMEDFLHIEHVPVADFCFIVPGTYRLPDDHSASSSDSDRSEASTDPTKSS